MIYLASPYSHPDDRVQEQRYLHVMEVASILMRQGLPVISPIVHCRPMALRFGLPHDAKFWEDYGRQLILACSAVYILLDDGWKTSKGIAVERKLAQTLKTPIHYINHTPGDASVTIRSAEDAA
jgi:hypothetical protein